MDIIIEESGSRNGFLAATAQEYAAQIAYIFRCMSNSLPSLVQSDIVCKTPYFHLYLFI